MAGSKITAERKKQVEVTVSYAGQKRGIERVCVYTVGTDFDMIQAAVKRVFGHSAAFMAMSFDAGRYCGAVAKMKRGVASEIISGRCFVNITKVPPQAASSQP